MPDLQLDPYAGVDWDVVERHEAQLHAHTSHPPVEGHSGSDPPDEVVDAYREAGYSVLALTGHEYNVEEPTWPWTDRDRDPDDLGIVAVPGVELHVADGVEHDLLSYFSELADTSGMDLHGALAEIGERAGLAVIPHPGRYHEDGEPYVEYFDRHPHLLGVEVVNAADRHPTDRDTWDDLLERLDGRRAAWGFANDDYHGREHGAYSFDRSRNVLFLEELTEAAVREALVEGRFVYQHVDEGEPPTVEAVHHDPDRGELRVEADGWEMFQWASAGEVVGREPSLRYREVEDLGSFARARLVSAGGSETGTQPFLFG